MRPLMMKALENLYNGEIAQIIIAPTGYGKTIASPEIYRILASKGSIYGLIHVAPLRSLVFSIYEEYFHGVGGIQAMGARYRNPEGWSPYMMRGLVVTTIDSFLWNLYRIPVLEYNNIYSLWSLGHYYPSLAAILSSVVVFDEAHLALDPNMSSHGPALVEAALAALSLLETPLLLETATMHPDIIKNVGSTMASLLDKTLPVIIPECMNRSIYTSKLTDAGSINVTTVCDRKWMKSASSISWTTEITDEWDNRLLRSIIAESEHGRVLVVLNTVERAKNVWRRLSEIGGGSNTLLIHGRLSVKDREEIERRIEAMSKGVIVSTQVAEAGVDINAVSVFTDAAPFESLIQRAGRACRRGNALEYCRSRGARIVLVKSGVKTRVYDEKAVETALTTIGEYEGDILDWRSPCPVKGRISVLELYAEQPIASRGSLRGNILTTLFSRLILEDRSPLETLLLLQEYNMCSIFRDTMLIPVIVRRGAGYDVLNLPLSYLHYLKNEKIEKLFVIENNRIVIQAINSVGEKVLEKPIEGPDVTLLKHRDCGSIANSLVRISHVIRKLNKNYVSWGLLAREDAYVPFYGLQLG